MIVVEYENRACFFQVYHPAGPLSSPTKGKTDPFLMEKTRSKIGG